jgi:16S rRNA (cytidine1402-2'-O)-methyltransferase
MASGLNGQSFAFHGYVPVDAVQRGKRLRELEQQSRRAQQTQLFIETPYRNRNLLEALLTHCAPTTLLSVAVDLTLPTEQIVTRPIAEWQLDTLELHKRPALFSILA